MVDDVQSDGEAPNARRRAGEKRNKWTEVVNTREGSVSVIEENVHSERPLTISRTALKLGPLVRARERSGCLPW